MPIHAISFGVKVEGDPEYSFWSEKGSEAGYISFCKFGPEAKTFDSKEKAITALTNLYKKFKESGVPEWLMNRVPTIVTISEERFNPTPGAYSE